MKKIVLLIDGRYTPAQIFLDKVIELAKQLDCFVDVLFDSRKMFPKRWYWSQIFSDHEMTDSRSSHYQQTQELLAQALSSHGVAFDMHELNSPDLAKRINSIAIKDETTLLALDSQLISKKHEILRQLSLLTVPVLLTNSEAWQKPLNVAAAVDPLHEHEPVKQTDKKLLKKLQVFSKRLSANDTILHSCYVPPIAIDHRKEILKIHEEALRQLISSSNIKQDTLVMLKGLPEESITKWLSSTNTDILMLGLLTRNDEVMNRHIGSTALSLIEQLPCDLLLIP